MISGSIVALVTPMLEDTSLDLEALEKLIEYHINSGTNGIVVAGTTGEAATLTFEERLQIIENSIAIVNNRVPIIAGTGTNSTASTIELTAAAKNLGVDACLLVTPYYNKPMQQGLLKHYETIADAVQIPQILYNVPSRTAVDLQVDIINKLSYKDNIVGIKESVVDSEKWNNILTNSKQGFALYSGDDATCMNCMLSGASGVISVAANVAPVLMQKLCEASLENNIEVAKKVNDQLESLYSALFIETNPIPVKYAVKMRNLIGKGIRLPLTELTTTNRQKLTNLISKIN